MIEEAQVVVHETHQPDLVLDFADADGLTGEDVAKALADADDGDRAIVEGILRLG